MLVPHAGHLIFVPGSSGSLHTPKPCLHSQQFAWIKQTAPGRTAREQLQGLALRGGRFTFIRFREAFSKVSRTPPGPWVWALSS